jgi:hypothetical protein
MNEEREQILVCLLSTSRVFMSGGMVDDRWIDGHF